MQRAAHPVTYRYRCAGIAPDMSDRKIKWLTYTVFVGLIPVLVRLLVWAVSQNRDMSAFHAADFVVFGLILHISIINEIEHFNDDQRSWKTIHNGTSIGFITVYGALFALHIWGQSNPGSIDVEILLYLAVVLSLVSALLGYSVYNRVSKLVQL